MKIIVAHSGLQYCNALLVSLFEKKWLLRFFTTFSANRLGWLPVFLPRRWRKALQKRAVDWRLTPLVRHFPALLLWERFRGKGLVWSVGHSYAAFDRAVAQRLKYYEFDLVITYENANLETLKTAKRLGKTTVLDLAQIHHDDILEYGQWFLSPERLEAERGFINPRKAEALRYTDYVLTLSSFAADSMRRHGWPAERLFTVNLGIDPELFTAKKQYPRGSGRLRLLFVGTMTLRKGLGVLFEALENMPEGSFELTLIGPMADARALVEQHAGNCTYLPFLPHDELARHYRNADLFVFPSLLDSWAQTVLEAMASGTPAIVSENTGAKDAVVQGGGWVVPANDARALREQLSQLQNRPEEIETAGREARRIAEGYTWAHYRTQVAEALQTIARHEKTAP